MTTTTTKYARYIDACHEAGLDNDSLLIDIIDVVFETMDAEGYDCGFGYTADDQDRDEAWDKANRIARAIDGRL
jgi:hypothetical protein